jgi:hypothetical protein
LRPLLDVPTRIRKLPANVAGAPDTGERRDQHSVLADAGAEAGRDATTGLTEPTADTAAHAIPPRRPAARVLPLSSDRFQIQCSISRECHDSLRRVQDLLRHAVPNGDLGLIVERALVLLLQDLERKKLAHTSRPREKTRVSNGSRHIASGVRREVWRRDEGRCAFVGRGGRCDERGFLELHHVVPFAADGPATVDNIELRCRAHNAYEASLHFAAPPEEDIAVSSPRGESKPRS